MEKEQVLIVEDDADIREGVRILLESENYHVSEAENGRKGLELLNRNFLSLGITLLFHIHKGIIGCRQALDFLAFRYFL